VTNERDAYQQQLGRVARTEHSLYEALSLARKQSEEHEQRAYLLGREQTAAEAVVSHHEIVGCIVQAAQTEHDAAMNDMRLRAQEHVDNARRYYESEADAVVQSRSEQMEKFLQNEEIKMQIKAAEDNQHEAEVARKREMDAVDAVQREALDFAEKVEVAYKQKVKDDELKAEQREQELYNELAEARTRAERLKTKHLAQTAAANASAVSHTPTLPLLFSVDSTLQTEPMGAMSGTGNPAAANSSTTRKSRPAGKLAAATNEETWENDGEGDDEGEPNWPPPPPVG